MTEVELKQKCAENDWWLYLRPTRAGNVNNYIIRSKGYSAYYLITMNTWQIKFAKTTLAKGHGLKQLKDFFDNAPEKNYKRRSESFIHKTEPKVVTRSGLTFEQRVMAEMDDNNYDYML